MFSFLFQQKKGLATLASNDKTPSDNPGVVTATYTKALFDFDDPDELDDFDDEVVLNPEDSESPESSASASSAEDKKTLPAPAIEPNEITVEALNTLLLKDSASVKQLIPNLVKAEKALARYLYLKKGLSTYKDKSIVTNVVNTAYNLATASTAPTFDMLDERAKTNMHYYRAYCQALEKAGFKTGEPVAFLHTLRNIAEKILPTPGVSGLFTAYKVTRFQVCIRDLLNAYEAAFKENENQQSLFLQAAKILHAPIRPTPGSNAPEHEVALFIKLGPVTPLARVLIHDLKSYPKTYALNEKGERIDPLTANRIDAKINYHLMKHQEVMSRPFTEIHPNEILHGLYQSLDILNEIDQTVLATETDEHFAMKAQGMQAHFQHYLKKEDGPLLLEALQFTTDYCDRLHNFLSAKPEARKSLDPDLANSYLRAMKSFTQIPLMQERLKGVAQTIASVGHKSYLDASKCK